MKELKLPPFIDTCNMTIKNQIKSKIFKVCEEHKIRLTPSEYETLVNDYFNHYIENIDVCSVIQLSENIEKRG